MRIDRSRRSENVEDLRGRGPGGGGGMRFGIVGTLVAFAAAWFFGIDPRVILGLMQATEQVAPSSQPEVQSGTPTDAAGGFVAAVLGDTEDTWGEIFRAGADPVLAGGARAARSGSAAADTRQRPGLGPGRGGAELPATRR